MTEKARNTGPTRSTSGKTDQTPPAPEGFVAAGETEDLTSAARQGEAEKRAAAEASGLESAPEGHRSPTGGSFHNPALVGSGTILADGTYGPPLPDPNVARLAEEAERLEREAQERDNQ